MASRLTPQLNDMEIRENIDALFGQGMPREQVQEYVNHYRKGSDGNYILKDEFADLSSARISPSNEKSPQGPLGGLANFIGGGKLAQGVGQTIANATGTQEKNTEALNKSIEIQTQLMQRIKEKKASGQDTSSLETALQHLTEDIKLEGGNIENLGTGGLSNKEVVGSALQLGADFIPGAAKGASLLGKVGTGAATGYAFDVANKLQSSESDKVEGKDFKPGIGTVIGATLPIVLKIGGYLAKNLTGFTSGSGTEAVQRALDNPEQVNTAIDKYATTPAAKRNLIDQAKTAIRDFVDSKQSEYSKTVGTLAQQEGSPVKLTKQPALDAFKNALKEFGVKISEKTEEESGKSIAKLDFTNSNLTSLDEKNIKQAFEKLTNWTDTTPQGIDKLRQTLINFMEDFKVQGNPRANVVISKAEDSLMTHLGENLPGYKDMVSQYMEKSQLTSEVLKELGFSGNAKPSTQLKTIMNLFKKSPEVRDGIVKIMGDKEGNRFMNELSGAIMSSWLPQGTVFGNVLRATPEVTAGVGAALAGHAPLAGSLAAPGAAILSPRIVGKTAILSSKAAQSGATDLIRKATSAIASKVANPNKK